MVAELSINHLGMVNIAKKMIDEAVSGGADLIKLKYKNVKKYYLKKLIQKFDIDLGVLQSGGGVRTFQIQGTKGFSFKLEIKNEDNNMTKQEWLEELVFVDIFGRQYNLSDVPMTYMTREQAFEKRGYGKKMVKQLWKEKVAEIRAES